MWILIVSLLGLCIGSFMGAQIWRVRAKQLVVDKKHHEKVDDRELTRLKPLSTIRQRDDYSRCLSCGQRLRWYDLVPIVSWVSTAGKCRYCHHKIGLFEPLMELATMTLFILSYLLWPWSLTSTAQIILFSIWLIALSMMIFLAAYDIRWQLLPDVINIPLIAVATVFVITRTVIVGDVSLLSVLGSIAMLAGLYGALYIVSKGAWIGFGDVKLGISLGLLLTDWQLAFVALFAANLIGCIIVLPGLLRRNLTRESKIAFGPLIIAGTLMAWWWGGQLITWLMLPGRFI
jgi:leader peptidase (prepilin peptidase)/N-methyltransferase